MTFREAVAGSEAEYQKLRSELLQIIRLEELVCNATGLKKEQWRAMTEEERVPYMREAIAKMQSVRGGKTPS